MANACVNLLHSYGYGHVRSQAARIRRLRVLEGDTWKLLRPNQHWRGGEVTSPVELETIDEEELGVYVDLSRVSAQVRFVRISSATSLHCLLSVRAVAL